MTSHLANNTLNDNLVTGNMAFIFDLLSDGIDDLLRPVLGVGVLILLVREHALNNRLYNVFNLGRIESI